MKQYSAEFLGTFWLVLGGCGSAVLAAAFPNVGIGLLGVALAFGLTVLTMAFAIGVLSAGPVYTDASRQAILTGEVSQADTAIKNVRFTLNPSAPAISDTF